MACGLTPGEREGERIGISRVIHHDPGQALRSLGAGLAWDTTVTKVWSAT
jgi:hypothetical protein